MHGLDSNGVRGKFCWPACYSATRQSVTVALTNVFMNFGAILFILVCSRKSIPLVTLDS